MAGKANGRPTQLGRKSSSKQPGNGHLSNGHAGDGLLSSTANGQASKPAAPTPSRVPRKTAPKRGFFRGVSSVIARILIWYTIITTAFRCPQSSLNLTDTSPKICTPYLQFKQAVAPYVDPYYDAHLKPYVEELRPYTDKLNKGFILPASTFAKNKYNSFVAPKVAEVQEYAGQQWEKQVAPQLTTVQAKAKAQYIASLGPYVDKAWDTANPYYQTAVSGASDLYTSKLLPAYYIALPYGQQAYEHGQHYAVHVGYPYAVSAWSGTSAFLGRTVWPQIRILYGENVEPQLVRISERLGRYRDGKRIQAAVESVEPIEDYTSTNEEATSEDSSNDPSSYPSADTIQISQSTERSKMVYDKEEVAQKIKNDLQAWQEKFAKAADKGTEDLEQRVGEITGRQIKSQAHGVGSALVTKLRETSASKMKRLQKLISNTLDEIGEDADKQMADEAVQKIEQGVQEAGAAIRASSQAIRTFKTKYDEETFNLVKAASESTLDVIDNIRDLGLQEIGMRWAWMEGVTYKDWSKYHALRQTFDEWSAEVEAVALNHEGLDTAKEEGQKVEDEAMKIAQNAAQQLVELRDTAKKTIYAKVSTKVKLEEKIQGSAADVGSAVSSKPTESVKSLASDASEAVFGGSTTDSSDAALHQTLNSAASSSIKVVSSSASEKLSHLASEASSSVAPASSSASRKVWGGAEAQSVAQAKEPVYDVEIEDDTESLGDKVKTAASNAEDWLARIVSEALGQPTTTQGVVESMTSAASDQYSRALEAASSVIYGAEKGTVESVTSVANEKYLAAVTAASLAIYGTPNPAYASVVAKASSSYAETTNALKAQFATRRAQIVIPGVRPGPAAKQALVMAHRGLLDEMERASTALQSALKATSSLSRYLPRATPPPGSWESITSVASVRMQEGMSMASAQFASAKLAVGAEPTPIHQAYMAEAQRKYYEGIGYAHDHYDSFVSAASTAVYGTPTPVYESLMSAASTAFYGTPTPVYDSILSAAKEQYREVSASAASVLEQALSSASSLAGATSKSPSETILASASSSYSAAISAAKVSYDSVASQASSNLDLLLSKASEQVYGPPTPYAESLYSHAGAYGAQATNVATEQYAALSSLVSELIHGKEPDFTESVMSRFSSAYQTGVIAYASAASSYASDAYASASSVIVSVFTPPPALEAILESASSQLDSAVIAASAQIYGTEKGTFEKATSAAASAAASAQSKVSEAVYGTQPSYAEAAQSSLAEIAAQAQKAVSEALYGTQTGAFEAAASGAASVYSAASSAAGDNYSAAKAAVTEAITAASAKASQVLHGPEQGAIDSASSRLLAAVESARARLAEYAAAGSSGVADNVQAAQSKIEEMASSISSAAGSAASYARDEL